MEPLEAPNSPPPDITLNDLWREMQRLHRLMDEKEHRRKRLHPRLDKLTGRRKIKTPTQKCPRCHGFGHLVSECTNEYQIVFTKEGRAVEVVENKDQMLVEELLEDPPRPTGDQEQLEEDFFHGEPIWDPEEEEEQSDELQGQISELFTESAPPHQPDVLEIRTNEAPQDPPETETYEVKRDLLPSIVLPSEPQQETSQTPKNDNVPPPPERKFITPKPDPVFTRSILLQLRSDVRRRNPPDVDPDPEWKAKPPDPGRMTGTVRIVAGPPGPAH